MLEAQNVTKTFGKGSTAFTALHDINVQIPKGKSAAIIGKSGSGKSTLMHVLSGLDKATSGRVTFDDQEITAMTRRQADLFRSREMSFIFQAFFVEGKRSCLDNVLLPLEIAGASSSNRVAEAEKALHAVGLGDKRNEKAKNLSGGQKQRLAVARAVVNKPKLIFADEPTGNLDSATSESIVELLFEVKNTLGATLVIVTHDKDIAAKCDMSIVLKDGRVDDISSATSKVKKTKGKRR